MGDEPLTLARAVGGDEEALRKLGASGGCIADCIAANRLGALLGSRARLAGVDGPACDDWQQALRLTAARRLMLETGLAKVGEILDAAGIDWLPLKGMGLPAGTYERLEERPTTDLDVLVRRSDLETAVARLREGGWRDVHPHPLSWRFLVEEGYNWQAVGPAPVLLELHFRLWGSVTEGFVAGILDRARPDPSRGRHALTIDPVDATIIAAVHVWQTPVPRPMLFLWDVHRLATVVLDEAGRQELVRRTLEAGLQLYLALSLSYVAALWPSESAARLASELAAACGRFEGVVLARSRARDWDRASLGAMVLARLLDGRPSRTGWKAPWRSLWPHPGTLASQYPAVSSRSWRRARYLGDLARRPSKLQRRGVR